MDNLQLKKTANAVRRDIVTEVYSAKAGHPGGSLSAADLFTFLYFEEMHIDPKNPRDPDRDRFVLSKGHTCPGLYAAMAERGYFPKEELPTFRHLGARLQGHPSMQYLPGLDMSSGSLGQGISAACGMALAGKIDGKNYRVYTLLGDGELEEGEVWEAAMFAGNQHLDNLCVIVDNNNLQIDGRIDDVNSPKPIDEKFAAFKFHVIKINGHDFNEIRAAFQEAKNTKGQPTLILASTIKGKGVSYMENQAGWHGKAPNAEQYETAMQDLDRIDEELAKEA
ncbi:MAG: transketolase [Lachnospiraceae bacterium]|jgi:transketolase|nr:transketolase [Lachnospiraceae bacterium]MCI1423105.1 transketolase [Lachnospiraceae bacterium]